MKTEDEFGVDRGIHFETDDEENQAEIDGGSGEEDNYSQSTNSDPADEADEPPYGVSWPRTYRDSMDMYGSMTQSSVFLQAGSSLTKLSNSILQPSLHKRSSSSNHEIESPLTTPFISTTITEASPLYYLPPHIDSFASSVTKYSSCSLERPRQCSYAQSVFNGINVLCGVGLLGTPYAIKEGGWLGLLVLFAFSIMACYTGILLKRCLESNPGLYTYPDIAQAAFGTTGRLIVSIFLYAELYAASVEFIILMGDNLSSLFPNFYVNLVGIGLRSRHFFAIMATITVLPTAWFRNFSFMSYLSAGGVIASLVVVICLLWVGVVDNVGFHLSGTYLNIANFPVAVGLYGFCYAGHAVFPNIYSSMENPADFPSVLIVSIIVCSILYSGVAVAGFLMFGEAIESQFTLNLPSQLIASKIAVWTTVVNPLTKYAITIAPVARSLEELLPPSHSKSYCISVLIRTVLVLSTLVVALTFPFFGFLMALIGSFITMIVTLIFPCASYLSIMRGKLCLAQVAGCSLIILVGIICSFVGTYSSLMKIIYNKTK